MVEASRRGLLDTLTGKMAANVLDANPDDPRAHRIIAEMLAEDNVRIAQTSPSLKRQVNEGNIVLGEDLFDGTPHYQWLHEFTNTLTVGVPGCGKTTFIREIAPQFAVHGCNVLLVDSEKEELRSLVPVFEKYGKTLRVIKGREFPFNPLEVPKENNPFEYLEHIALTIGSALDVLEPGIRLLKEVIHKLYFEYGLFEGKRLFPLLFEVREEVAKNRNCNQLTQEALLARLDSVLLNTPGLRFRVGESTERLSANNVILECAGMAPPARDLLVGTIITKEFLRRKQVRYINAPVSWAVFIDDGQRICANPEGHLAQSINIIRSTGITINFSVQSAHLVAPAILANTSTKLFGILASAEDLQFLAKTMLLTNEQKEWFATKLRKGQFLYQLGNGWRVPSLLEVHPDMVHDYLSSSTVVPIERRIGNAHFDQGATNSSVWASELVEEKKYVGWIPPEWKVSTITKTEKTSPKPLTEREEEFLRVVIQSPGQPCSSYNKKLSFSQKFALAVRKQLIEKSLIYEEQVRTQQFGRTAKLVIPSETGKELLSQILKEREGYHD